jgi:hypothetical protein
MKAWRRKRTRQPRQNRPPIDPTDQPTNETTSDEPGDRDGPKVKQLADGIVTIDSAATGRTTIYPSAPAIPNLIDLRADAPGWRRAFR